MAYYKSVFLRFKSIPISRKPHISARSLHFNSFINKNKNANDYLHQIISEVRHERKYLNIIPNFENVLITASKFNSNGRGQDIIGTVLSTYHMIEKAENITEELIRQAFVLAWAAQMTDSYTRIINTHNCDSPKKLSEVSDKNLKHADLLRSFLYVMIEQNFEDTNWYQDILKLYNKAYIYNRIGQYLEESSRKQLNKHANISLTLYEMLCDYKVSYPLFELPFFLAMTLANKTDKDLLRNVGRICSDMGMLYQIKQDYENCFGIDAMTETGETDIQTGKCTWLAVTALERFTPRQRLVFEACYGSDEPAHFERVKLLYEQIQIPRLYREKEGALCDGIMQQAEALEQYGVPYKLFEEVLEGIRI